MWDPEITEGEVWGGGGTIEQRLMCVYSIALYGMPPPKENVKFGPYESASEAIKDHHNTKENFSMASVF